MVALTQTAPETVPLLDDPRTRSVMARFEIKPLINGPLVQAIQRDALQVLVDDATYNEDPLYCVTRLHADIGLYQPFGAASDLVAAQVFAAAAEAEGGMERNHYRDPHPILRKFMVGAAAEFYGRETPAPSSAAVRARDGAVKLYVGSGHPAETDTAGYLYRLGVHAASESSAAYDEFTPLDRCVHRVAPELYAHLERGIHPSFPGVNAATWLNGHGEVEAVHAGYAFNAAWEAIHSLAVAKREEAFTQFLAGFEEFYRQRYEFFNAISH